MPNSRTVFMSLDHLVAEMVAFPFVSRHSLETPIDSLDGKVKKNGKTGALWRAAEQYFVAHFPHLGLDELIAVRNRTWFDVNHGITPLHTYLKQVANDWLLQRGPIAEPTLPEAEGNDESHDAAARRAWRWLTFAMPGDLLLAGLSRDGYGPIRCELLNPFVKRILRENGYAETHLHMGAGLDFPTAWASAVNLVGRSPDQQYGMDYDAFQSPGADFDEGLLLGNWLVRSAIVRYLLATFLNWGNNELVNFLEDGDIWQSLNLSDSHVASIRLAIRDLANGALTLPDAADVAEPLQVSFIALQSAYSTLTGVSRHDIPEELDAVQCLDPLSAFYAAGKHSEPSIQIQFLWCGIDHLENFEHDKRFASPTSPVKRQNAFS